MRFLQWKILVYIFYGIWSIFRPYSIFYFTMVYFVAIWYIFPVLVYCATQNQATGFSKWTQLSQIPQILTCLAAQYAELLGKKDKLPGVARLRVCLHEQWFCFVSHHFVITVRVYPSKSCKYLGSMLWSQFSAVFDNFRRKNWRFSQKPM
jgi:hypothetical protein